MPNIITICLNDQKTALKVRVNNSHHGHRFPILEADSFTLIWPVYEGDGAEALRTFAQQCLEAAAELSGPADAL